MNLTAPGWYPDPNDPAKQLYWDGNRWGESRTAGEAVLPEQRPQGWYPDPVTGVQRWWDGNVWGPNAPQAAQSSVPSGYQVAVPAGLQEKSSGIAVLLTVLWPGAGHLYLGLTKKAVPFVVANAIGFVLGLTGVLLPITVVIWLVTLAMTVGKVTDETNMVNDALRRGLRIDG